MDLDVQLAIMKESSGHDSTSVQGFTPLLSSPQTDPLWDPFKILHSLKQTWFKTVNPNSEWDKVSLEGVEDVADLKRAISKGMNPASFTIKATYNDDKDPENAIKLDPETKLKTVPEQVPLSSTKIRFFVILPPAPGEWDSLLIWLTILITLFRYFIRSG